MRIVLFLQRDMVNFEIDTLVSFREFLNYIQMRRFQGRQLIVPINGL